MHMLAILVVCSQFGRCDSYNDFLTSWKLPAFKRCEWFETCSYPCLNLNAESLYSQLESNLFGQPLALNAVYRTIKAHLNGNPERPLALSLHGPTGVGKNHIARLVVNSLYSLGYKSSFVHHFVASRDFVDIENTNKSYKRWMIKIIEKAVWKCPYATFIFDEMDKMPVHLIDSISSFLDFNSHEMVSMDRKTGLDFRKSIFIFLSNTGERLIMNYTLNAWKNKISRESFRLENFEVILTNSAFNEEGGLWHTDLIKRHLISFFIPLLPLERSHLIKCVQSYLIKNNYSIRNEKEENEFALRVLKELIYIPPNLELFSSSGCKRIPEKVELLMLNDSINSSLEYADKNEL